MATGKDHLELSAHQDDGWGDICNRHPLPGHHKVLEVAFTYSGKAVINYDRTQVIGIVRDDFDRLSRRKQITAESLPASPIVAATKKTFASLSISEKLLVRHVYHNPNTATAFLLPVLSEMGFPTKVAGDSLNKVLTTNLVSRDTINTFPNPDVKEIVSQLVDHDNLPTADVIRSIASETTAAVQFTAQLGCEKLVDELKQKHSGEISALSSKLTGETSAKLFHEGESRHLREQNDRDVAGIQKLLDEARTSAAERENELAEIRKQREIPQLLLEYVVIDRHDTFTFTNQGPGSIQNIVVEQVTMSKRQDDNPSNRVDSVITITSFSGVGILHEGREFPNWRFGAKDAVKQYPLPSLLSEFREHGWDSIFSAVVTYEDMALNRYARNFALSLDAYSNITVRAEPPKVRA